MNLAYLIRKFHNINWLINVPNANIREYKYKSFSLFTNINILAKDTNFNKIIERDSLSHTSVEEFFNKLYRQYVEKEDFENDLFFSTYMCNSVVNYILDCILENTIKSYSLQICS